MVPNHFGWDAKKFGFDKPQAVVTIGVGSTPDAWNHGTVLNEGARVSPCSLQIPLHRGRAIASPRALSDGTQSTRHANGPVSMKCGRVP
jgi:hypothetical protein